MSNTKHKLLKQLSAADCSEEEIAELFTDLKFVYENPFDAAIEEAITVRGCTYVELSEQAMN